MSEFTLTTSDGIDLRARWHGICDGCRTAVVLVHGFTASMDHPDVVAVAEALAEAGHRVFCYDARGHSGSGGLSTLGDAERHDVAAAVAEALEAYDRVVTVGASMGAIAALRQAAGNSAGGLAGVVTVSSPARWRLPRNVRTVLGAALTRTAYGRRVAARRMGVRIHPVWADPLEPESLAAHLNVPLAVIHGDADPMIHWSEGRLLAAAAGGPTRLEIVPGMRHAFDPRAIPAIIHSVRWALTTSAVA
jgi:alpha-beta hydrolase superfamily lysophospholipase